MATIKFKTVAVKPGETEAVFYVPRPMFYNTLDRNDIVKLASRDAKIEKGLLERVYDSFVVQVEELVMNGHAITLGDLGILKVGAHVKSQKVAEDVSAEDLKGLRIKLVPSVAVKEALADMNLVLAENVYAE